MPAFIQNSTAIAISNKNIIDGKSSYDRIDSFFEKIKYVLDNCFNDVNPQLLNFTINANGDVDVDTDYLDLLPAKDNKMINELHKAMKNRFINAIEKDIWYEGPDNYTNFDEVSSEEDSPYESPIFTSDDLFSVGLNFESSYDFDDLAPLCKKALEYLEDEYSIELVDYQGTYEYFESGKNNFDEIRESDGEWDKAYIEKLIKENDYENGSKDGDELILKIAAHPNTNPTFLEDFVLSGAHPIIVALHVVKNSSVNSDLLNKTWEENEKWWNNDEIRSTILGHPNCPESLKLDDGENEMLEKFTHVIELKDDSEYNIDPHFGENSYVDSLDFFKDSKSRFKSPFITYFQKEEPFYSLNFVKYDGEKLFHAEVSDLDDFSEFEDGSDEYYDFMRSLDEGYLDIRILDDNEEVDWSELKDIKMSEEKDIYDLTPFNMDYEDEDHIDDCRDGKFYIEKAKSGIESFEVEFASFGQARCFYRYIWDDAKLTQIIVENGDLFEDDEIDEGLDDETWNEAIEHEYFPDIVEKAIEDGECEVKVLFEK
jgi:hypothetical protein